VLGYFVYGKEIAGLELGEEGERFCGRWVRGFFMEEGCYVGICDDCWIDED
jgi:hypothetical protein